MTCKMDTEIKAKWLAELRGGKIKQTRGTLLDHKNRMCCLGVLVYVQLGAEPMEYMRDQDKSEDLAVSGLCLTFPEQSAGLLDEVQQRLVHMNDCGKSFAEIADFIEANY